VRPMPSSERSKLSMYDRVVRDVFCKKCHWLAAQIVRDKKEIKIMQGGEVLLSLSKEANLSMNVPVVSATHEWQ